MECYQLGLLSNWTCTNLMWATRIPRSHCTACMGQIPIMPCYRIPCFCQILTFLLSLCLTSFFDQFDPQEFQVAVVTSILPLQTPKRLRHDGHTLRMDGTQVGILKRWGRMGKSPKKSRRWEITLWKIHMLNPKSWRWLGDDFPVQIGWFLSPMRFNFQGVGQFSSCPRMPKSHIQLF